LAASTADGFGGSVGAGGSPTDASGPTRAGRRGLPGNKRITTPALAANPPATGPIGQSIGTFWRLRWGQQTRPGRRALRRAPVDRAYGQREPARRCRRPQASSTEVVDNPVDKPRAPPPKSGEFLKLS